MGKLLIVYLITSCLLNTFIAKQINTATYDAELLHKRFNLKAINDETMVIYGMPINLFHSIVRDTIHMYTNAARLSFYAEQSFNGNLITVPLFDMSKQCNSYGKVDLDKFV